MALDLILRALAVWLIIIVAEIVHGVGRVRWLEPRVGNWRARQIAVFTGSILVVAIALLTVSWMNPPGPGAALGVGLIWVTATVIFELLFGRYVAGLSWHRLMTDFNIVRGGLMPIGLIIMLLAPWLAKRMLSGF